MSSTLAIFQRADAGWSEADNIKARSMILRQRTDGTPRYTDAQIAAYMGMTTDYVAGLRRTTPKPRPSVHNGMLAPVAKKETSW